MGSLVETTYLNFEYKVKKIVFPNDLEINLFAQGRESKANFAMF